MCCLKIFTKQLNLIP